MMFEGLTSLRIPDRKLDGPRVASNGKCDYPGPIDHHGGLTIWPLDARDTSATTSPFLTSIKQKRDRKREREKE